MREQWVENKGAGLIVPANRGYKYLVATLTSLFHKATCGVPGLVTTERGWGSPGRNKKVLTLLWMPK